MRTNLFHFDEVSKESSDVALDGGHARLRGQQLLDQAIVRTAHPRRSFIHVQLSLEIELHTWPSCHTRPDSPRDQSPHA